MKTKTLYKSLPANLITHGHQWVVGKWYKIEGELKICENGFHASQNIVDAMNFVSAEVLAIVEVKGESIIEKEKECWQEMRLVEIKEWKKKDSVSLAVFAAELVLANFEKKYPDDMRPRKAIESAKRVLENDNEKNRKAAVYAHTDAIYAYKDAAGETYSANKADSSAANAARNAANAAQSAATAAQSAANAAQSAANAARNAANAARNAAAAAQSAAAADWNAAAAATYSAQYATYSAQYAAYSAQSAAQIKNVRKKCHDFVLQRLGWDNNEK